jgi:hypothetical protein
VEGQHVRFGRDDLLDSPGGFHPDRRLPDDLASIASDLFG